MHVSLTIQKLEKEGRNDTFNNNMAVIILQVPVKTYTLLWSLVLDTQSALNLHTSSLTAATALP